MTIAVGFHFSYLVLVFFLAGYVIHFLLQVEVKVRANNNKAKSRVQLLKDNLLRIIARFFVSAMIFGIVWTHPTVLVSLLGYLGVNVTGGFADVLSLPMNVFTSGLWGFGIDSALAYIPYFSTIAPPLDIPSATAPSAT
jgi:heme/copper-type cytochrome/quinol oxidase subunit 2